MATSLLVSTSILFLITFSEEEYSNCKYSPLFSRKLSEAFSSKYLKALGIFLNWYASWVMLPNVYTSLYHSFFLLYSSFIETSLISCYFFNFISLSNLAIAAFSAFFILSINLTKPCLIFFSYFYFCYLKQSSI